MKQLTLNPQTKQWEMLTTSEWRLLKAGYAKNATGIPDYEVDFKVSFEDAVAKWSATKDRPIVKTHILEVLVKTLTLTPLDAANFCIWFYHTFDYGEVERQQGRIQEARRTINEIKQLVNSINTKPKKRRGKRR